MSKVFAFLAGMWASPKVKAGVALVAAGAVEYMTGFFTGLFNMVAGS
jgi:hypothetical protein